MKELPFGFGYPFFARVILPGQLGAASLLFLFGPLLQRMWPSLDGTDKLALLGSAVLFVGMLAWILDTRIYWLYEGISWPRRIREAAKRRLQRRVTLAMQEAEVLSTTDDLAYAVVWDWLRRFPIGSDGIPRATRATELGNILAAAESYPRSRYGMTSHFYWHRIWLSMDEQARSTIDRNASRLDGTLYLSFVLLCSSCLYLIAAAIQLILSFSAHATLPSIQSPEPLMIAGVLAALFSRVTYRWSLDLAGEKGEYYKSIFDVYRGKVTHMTAEITDSEKELWEKTWRYLRYQQIHCRSCHKYYPASDEGCPHCSSSGVSR